MKRIVLLLTAVLALFSSVKGSNDADAVLGKLYFVNLKEGEQPVMTGLSLFGNRCGSEDFNHKPCAAEGIRSVFELDEWIEFHPQASAKTGIKVMVFKHNADQGFYLKNALNGDTSGYIQECELKETLTQKRPPNGVRSTCIPMRLPQATTTSSSSTATRFLPL